MAKKLRATCDQKKKVDEQYTLPSVTSVFGETIKADSNINVEEAFKIASDCLKGAHTLFDVRVLSNKRFIKLDDHRGVPIISNLTVNVICAQYIIRMLETKMPSGLDLMYYLTNDTTELTTSGMVTRGSCIKEKALRDVIAAYSDVVNILFGNQVSYLAFDDSVSVDSKTSKPADANLTTIVNFVSNFIDIYDKTQPIIRDVDFVICMLCTTIGIVRKMFTPSRYAYVELPVLDKVEIPDYLSDLSFDRLNEIITNAKIEEFTKDILSHNGLDGNKIWVYDPSRKWYGFNPDIGAEILETYVYTTIKCYIEKTKWERSWKRCVARLDEVLRLFLFAWGVYDIEMPDYVSKLITFKKWSSSYFKTIDWSDLANVPLENIQRDLAMYDKKYGPVLKVMCDTIARLYEPYGSDFITYGATPEFKLVNGKYKLSRVTFTIMNRDTMHHVDLIKNNLVGVAHVQADAIAFNPISTRFTSSSISVDQESFSKIGKKSLTDFDSNFSPALDCAICGISLEEMKKRVAGICSYLEFSVDPDRHLMAVVEKVEPRVLYPTSSAPLIIDASSLKIFNPFAHGANANGQVPIQLGSKDHPFSKPSVEDQTRVLNIEDETDIGLFLFSFAARDVSGADAEKLHSMFINRLYNLVSNADIRMINRQGFGMTKVQKKNGVLYRMLASSGLVEAVDNTKYGQLESTSIYLPEEIKDTCDKINESKLQLPNLLRIDTMSVPFSCLVGEDQLKPEIVKLLMTRPEKAIRSGVDRYGNIMYKLSLAKTEEGSIINHRNCPLYLLEINVNLKDDIEMPNSGKVWRWIDEHGKVHYSVRMNYKDSSIQSHLMQGMYSFLIKGSKPVNPMSVYSFNPGCFVGTTEGSSTIDICLSLVIRELISFYRVRTGYWQKSEVSKSVNFNVIKCHLVEIATLLYSMFDGDVRLSEFGTYSATKVADFVETVSKITGIKVAERSALTLTTGEITKISSNKVVKIEDLKDIISKISPVYAVSLAKVPEIDDIMFVHVGQERWISTLIKNGLDLVEPPIWVDRVLNSPYSTLFADEKDAMNLQNLIVRYLNYAFPYISHTTDTNEEPQIGDDDLSPDERRVLEKRSSIINDCNTLIDSFNAISDNERSNLKQLIKMVMIKSKLPDELGTSSIVKNVIGCVSIKSVKALIKEIAMFKPDACTSIDQMNAVLNQYLSISCSNNFDPQLLTNESLSNSSLSSKAIQNLIKANTSSNTSDKKEEEPSVTLETIRNGEEVSVINLADISKGNEALKKAFGEADMMPLDKVIEILKKNKTSYLIK